MLNNFLFKFELKKVLECLWHTPGQGIIVEVVELVGLLAIMPIITNNPNHLHLMFNTSSHLTISIILHCLVNLC